MKPHTTKPDTTDYKDEGCDLHEACLTCPLPACRYDLSQRSWTRSAVRAEIAEAYLQGGNARAVAVRFAVSVRTVHRAVRQSADGKLAA